MSFRGYFLGCPIWSNKDWVGELFAKDAKQKDYLRQYASVFNTVEGNTRGVHADGTDDPAGQAARRKKPKVPVRFTATGPRPFMRFVGYPDVDENIPLLAEWAPVVARWMREGRTPFIFMHAPNDYYAPRLARHFHRLLSEHIDAGDMPVWPAERTAEQMRLF